MSTFREDPESLEAMDHLMELMGEMIRITQLTCAHRQGKRKPSFKRVLPVLDRIVDNAIGNRKFATAAEFQQMFEGTVLWCARMLKKTSTAEE